MPDPTPSERRARRRARLDAASDIAWAVLSWLAVLGMAALVVLLVLAILLCAGVR